MIAEAATFAAAQVDALREEEGRGGENAIRRERKKEGRTEGLLFAFRSLRLLLLRWSAGHDRFVGRPQAADRRPPLAAAPGRAVVVVFVVRVGPELKNSIQRGRADGRTDG